jgi:hypothetical protein
MRRSDEVGFHVEGGGLGDFPVDRGEGDGGHRGALRDGVRNLDDGAAGRDRRERRGERGPGYKAEAVREGPAGSSSQDVADASLLDREEGDDTQGRAEGFVHLEPDRRDERALDGLPHIARGIFATCGTDQRRIVMLPAGIPDVIEGVPRASTSGAEEVIDHRRSPE